jgi:conjugative relaxase-like TrwC/TraI family protein
MHSRKNSSKAAQHQLLKFMCYNQCMGYLIDSVTSPARIEYARAAIDPKKYLPAETIDIANYSAGGSLWAELGIPVPPTMDQLRQVVRGKNPITGGRLTARTHANSEQQHRTSFYSSLFNVPKSISIVSELGGDIRLRREVLTAAKLVMDLAEKELAGFRLRKKGAKNKNSHFPTGSMGYILYLENDSRYFDPNIHLHAFIINATRDISDSKRPYKALSAVAIFRAQKLITALFHQLLEKGIQKLGYDTVSCPDNGAFEISGIPRPLIDKFSKGHHAIKHAAANHAQKKSDATAIKRERGEWEAEVALRIRPKKKKETQSQLQARWQAELTLGEEQVLVEVVHRARLRLLQQAQSKTVPRAQVEGTSQPAANALSGNYFLATESVMPTEAPVDWNATLEVPPLSYFLSAVAQVNPHTSPAAPPPIILSTKCSPEVTELSRFVPPVEPLELPEL